MSELQSCVVYGLALCALAYASAARVKGPSLCQKGSVGTLFATGIWLSAGPGVFLFDEDCCRDCLDGNWCRRDCNWRRSAVR